MKILPPTTSRLKNQLVMGGFTLLEILVVISIIAILAGMIFPALQGAKETAKRAKARNTINTIGIGLTSYFNEYGRFPDVQQVGDTNQLDHSHQSDLVKVLLGDSAIPQVGDGTSANPRKKVFADFASYELKGTGANTNVVDPWGNDIRISVDGDGDGFTCYTNNGVIYTVTNQSWIAFTIRINRGLTNFIASWK